MGELGSILFTLRYFYYSLWLVPSSFIFLMSVAMLDSKGFTYKTSP